VTFLRHRPTDHIDLLAANDVTLLVHGVNLLCIVSCTAIRVLGTQSEEEALTKLTGVNLRSRVLYEVTT